jgi:hypothetical protein
MDCNCPLCDSASKPFFQDTYSCPTCYLVFKSPEIFISKAEEEARYNSHQNSTGEQGYIDFLNRLAIPLKEFIRKDFTLLDYGCGPYSQIAKILEPEVADTKFYDPQFFPNELSKQKFDVVTCTEVVEHFKGPKLEWEKLVAAVKPKGILGIMTQFYNDEIDFKSWWYKNDPTHVVFYRPKTLDFLAQKYQMKILYNDRRSVIIFQNGN